MFGQTERMELQSQGMEGGMHVNTLLGEGLSPEAEQHIRQAGLSYHADDVAETHLLEARQLAPGHVAVLISLYRFYFYKGRLSDALDVARACLEKAARENNLPTDWRLAEPGDAAFDRYEGMWPRFYLFTLKGYAYLKMRLGEIGEGTEAVHKLLELDPGDKIGARILLDVIERSERNDDD